jgi:DNA-binding transcriptional MocR family regulator
VINAYDLLKSDGLIKTIKGKGTFVSYEIFQTENEQTIKTQYDWSGCFEENMNTAYNEVIQLIMDSNHRDGKIFMAGGLPSPELTPIDEFHSIRLNYTYPKANEIYKGIEIINA